MSTATQRPPEIKSPKELDLMREAGVLLAAALSETAAAAAPGVSTAELDRVAEAAIRGGEARPAFLDYRGYPATLCASVNSEVVHAVPKADRLLRDGDIVSLDLGCVLKGYYADAAMTVPVGKVSPEARNLIETARRALEAAIEAMRPGKRLGDIGHAVQSTAEAQGFSVVRAFVGHGIGRALHEAPAIPNHGRPGTGLRLAPGMVLALEPMVNMKGAEVRILDDGWTAVTCDGGWSAHFEHTVAVTEDGPRILTLPIGEQFAL